MTSSGIASGSMGCRTPTESRCKSPTSRLSAPHPDIVMAKSGAGALGGRPRTPLPDKSAAGACMADIARLTEVIEPEANALGFELVRVKLSGQGEERTLQVMAEDPATGQLVGEQCMALSRRISDRIDAVEEAGEELIGGC